MTVEFLWTCEVCGEQCMIHLHGDANANHIGLRCMGCGTTYTVRGDRAVRDG